MRRLSVMAAALFVVLAGALTTNAGFGGNQLSGNACGSGTTVVNVTEKVVNDSDSGFAGYWATESYNRQIQIVQTGPGQFCAVVAYDGGQFVTYAGLSPAGTHTLAAGIKGTMSGGRRAEFTGTLNPSPAWRTRGSVGTVDYQCDQAGNCPGYVSYLDVYFTSHGPVNEPYWGWEYKTPKNGTWVNASAGSSGDIY